MYSSRGGAPGGAKSARACITSLRALQAKIILADFNLAVSTQTAKPPNLIPHQIFRLYGMYVVGWEKCNLGKNALLSNLRSIIIV